MRTRAKKKARTSPENIDIGDEDRLSRLPDELIHRILSFVDAKEAVQTSVLSRRWKLIWTTLPFLTFGPYKKSSHKNDCKFIRHVLSNRNHQFHLSELNFRVNNRGFSKCLLDKFVACEILRNVKSYTLELLDDHRPYKLSTFSSKSLEKLTLRVYLEKCELESDYWDLPALTTLHLKCPLYYEYESWINDSLFKCLPSLTTLCLYGWDLSKPSFSFSLPTITTLRLYDCQFPKTVWDFPALVSIQLEGSIPKNLNDMFSALVNLQNLTIIPNLYESDIFISFPPQLLNLSIRTKFCISANNCSNIVVSAPKLCNLTLFGIFKATIGVPELENVNIRLHDWFHNMELTGRKQYYRRLTNMLPGLGNAKNLTFDLETIEAVNEISNLRLPSPFGKLKYVKLPGGVKESSISSALRSYLLGGSPKATFVTKFPQNKVNHQAVPVSMTSQTVMLDVPFATPTNVKSVVNADMVRQIGAPVARTRNDRAISSRGDSDFGLWHGHEVNLEFVGLLDLIIKKYPQTFEHFTAKSERFHSMMLNMFCNSVNEFFKTSMTEFNTDIITEYRDLFADLQRWGFNVVWLVSHLHYVEQLLISQHELHANDSRMDDAKNKLQELQTHCLEKITEIQKASR